jgi:hypothetical protein
VAGVLHIKTKYADASHNGMHSPSLVETASYLPNARKILSWLLLSFCGSVLLLATTNQMCQNITVVPLLWILPLSIYLATFIISFERDHWYRRVWSIPLYAITVILLCGVLTWGKDIELKLQLIIYALVLFAGCMVCHGELARARPIPKYLTLYFLLIATGGALGGFFVALAAPVVFPDYWEYHLAVGGVIIVALAALFFDSKSPLYNGQKLWAWIPMFLSFSILIAILVRDANLMRSDSLEITRSFFGVLNVADRVDVERRTYRELYHGQIVHGIQYTDTSWRNRPTAYYGEGTGIWLALNHLPRRIDRKSIRVGVIGLGTGTMATFAREGDNMRFYEINPDVVRLSREWFSYTQDSKADIEVVLGDGRIQLERELADGERQQFDVLIADAFTGDAVPLHLLTSECVQIYRQHLKDDGILAIQISNQYLNLLPVTLGLANTLGWELVLIDSKDNLDDATWSATWVLITNNRSFLNSEAVQKAKTVLKEGFPKPVLWTDEYASLLHVIM